MKSGASKPGTGKSGAGSAGSGKTGTGNAGMKHFEERLERLEFLGEVIRKSDVPLDEALKSFEEGIKLARSLEKDLEKVEERIEILTSAPDAKSDADLELDLFDEGE